MRWRDRERRAVAAVAEWSRLPVGPGGQPDLRLLAEGIGRAVGAAGCWVRVGGHHHGWGADGPGAAVAVEHGGQVQGSFGLVPAPAGSVGELAAALGPVLAAGRLHAEADALRRRGDAAARELADARWHAAAEMEAERRRLERDLHDGAQHQLVALKLAAALAEHAAASGDLAAAARALAGLADRLDAAEAVVERTAAGVLPLALVSDGLVAALAAEFAGHADVTLDAGPDVPHCPPAAATAVYFICVEAVNNARKHAPGAAVAVTLRGTPGSLGFSVTDDGPGFAELPPDAGLHHLGSRATAVGGWVRVRSTPGRGTTVSGAVPTA
ncbi:sensor histidine kinase [Actinosynnema sp. NPDC053489]|uniref:sensor histidine kinase n=1 Tax=Actinosynnema sp. NPDC053489 TaxID=3363916 RepID=UPI0037C7F37C